VYFPFSVVFKRLYAFEGWSHQIIAPQTPRFVVNGCNGLFRQLHFPVACFSRTEEVSRVEMKAAGILPDSCFMVSNSVLGMDGLESVRRLSVYRRTRKRAIRLATSIFPFYQVFVTEKKQTFAWYELARAFNPVECVEVIVAEIQIAIYEYTTDSSIVMSADTSSSGCER
jgi:hypothetical protein